LLLNYENGITLSGTGMCPIPFPYFR
jgi:hypothetical protein